MEKSGFFCTKPIDRIIAIKGCKACGQDFCESHKKFMFAPHSCDEECLQHWRLPDETCIEICGIDCRD